jgi:squalene synthase HpnC
VNHDGTRISAGFHQETEVEPTVADALAARATQENFPVALKLLPARYRAHLMAVYAFARTVDDIGDEAPAGDRLRLLEDMEADLARLYAQLEPVAAKAPGGREAGGGAGYAGGGAGYAGGGDARGIDGRSPAIAAIRELAPAVSECSIPMRPFQDLIRANQQDQVVSRYQTFEDLVGYCRLSADPVGRIVLHVFGSYTDERAALSDAICTALQLAEHWQDVAEDLRAGRIYLPLEDLDRYGCAAEDLAADSADLRVRALLRFEVERARKLMAAGAPLIGTLRGFARAAVAGYVAGGRAALAAIESADYDVLRGPPAPRRRRVAAELGLAYVRGR